MDEYVFDYYEYKKRIKNPIKFSLSLTVFFVIILVGLCAFLNQPKVSLIEYNFVEVGQFATYTQASKTAQNLAAQTGAGFIYFDNCYHVFAGFYTCQSDAEKVAKNIVEFYPNATATTISACKFKQQRQYTKTQNLAIQNMIEATENCIETLSKLSVEIDTSTTLKPNLNLKLGQIKDDFSSVLSSFKSNFNQQLTGRFDISNSLSQIQNSLTNIISAAPQGLQQSIKYELINIVVNQARFLNAFA